MTNNYPIEFDSIRPYTDAEISPALERIVKEDSFELAAKYTYPELSYNSVKEKILSIRNINEFQHTIMLDLIKKIIRQTISEFSISGMDYLNANKAYLFVSNHRDIVLDAFLLQKELLEHEMNTCQITFGANLMKHPLVLEIGKINKMFKVERGGSLKTFYASMSLVSSYMRYCIEQRKESVWIAQRNGRTKDGIDQTEPSLIKMFAKSGGRDHIKDIESLNIVPVSISYEWEPCDYLKAIELRKTINGIYTKSPNEDLQSILTGIMQQKGMVHISINRPISDEDLNQYCEKDGDFYKWVAHLMDCRICNGYKLMKNNYVAYDILYNDHSYAEYYTKEDYDQFVYRLQELKHAKKMDEKTCNIFLKIYANPVIAKNNFFL